MDPLQIYLLHYASLFTLLILSLNEKSSNSIKMVLVADVIGKSETEK